MNKQMKRSIQKAFEAPQPNQQEKARFLETLPQPQTSMWKFILIQATYLRKWTLLFSVLLLFPALIGAYHIEKNTLWLVSAFVPFLGLLAVTENARSMVYGMNEFEMSARFSLRSVILARMGVLGLLDLLIFCCLIPLCHIGNHFSLFQTGIYLLVPYLLTITIGLWITRCFHSREAIYGCMSVAVLISGADMEIHLIVDFVYQSSCITWWFVLFVLLVGRIIYETYCTITQTEELAWNL
ncbi:MAG: hypothetical protein HFI10_10670 [Lachnospiraceae bacterium]|jgi:hypothetical protein|nr:hypothetical protein [Lachnospiraceae bacterium]